MTKEDIIQLGNLVRIKLSESEEETFNQEISSILEYVSTVKNITADSENAEPKVGARFNVLRDDIITNEPGFFSEALLQAMPDREGQFMSVKKILKPPE